MTERMTIARFRALAAAYGGAIARWPVETRAAAAALAREIEARAVLADADRLDARLEAWMTPAAPPALRDRITASYDRTYRARARRLRLWWSGVGVAATLAGAAAGSVAAAAAAPGDPPTEAATAFGDVGVQGD